MVQMAIEMRLASIASFLPAQFTECRSYLRVEKSKAVIG